MGFHSCAEYILNNSQCTFENFISTLLNLPRKESASVPSHSHFITLSWKQPIVKYYTFYCGLNGTYTLSNVVPK